MLVTASTETQNLSAKTSPFQKESRKPKIAAWAAAALCNVFSCVVPCTQQSPRINTPPSHAAGRVHGAVGLISTSDHMWLKWFQWELQWVKLWGGLGDKCSFCKGGGGGRTVASDHSGPFTRAIKKAPPIRIGLNAHDHKTDHEVTAPRALMGFLLKLLLHIKRGVRTLKPISTSPSIRALHRSNVINIPGLYKTIEVSHFLRMFICTLWYSYTYHTCIFNKNVSNSTKSSSRPKKIYAFPIYVHNQIHSTFTWLYAHTWA